MVNPSSYFANHNNGLNNSKRQLVSRSVYLFFQTNTRGNKMKIGGGKMGIRGNKTTSRGRKTVIVQVTTGADGSKTRSDVGKMVRMVSKMDVLPQKCYTSICSLNGCVLDLDGEGDKRKQNVHSPYTNS